MRPEWKDRVQHWIHTLEKEFYEPLGDIAFEGFTTFEMLDPAQAEAGCFAPMPVGTAWGRTWEYAWLRADLVMPERAAGKPIVMDLQPGGEATVFVDGKAFGTRRADWIKARHHYIADQILTLSAQPGDRYHLLVEAYAGHDRPESELGACATGPVRVDEGDYLPLPDDVLRRTIARSTFGVWHEEAYQLWKDVTTLQDMLSVIDETSLRAAKVEEALEQFTLLVDFEQPREKRLADYVRAHEALRPVMEAKNGSTAPQFYAIGNAHLDVCWLWPYRETQRKVARTFAQQVRLMDLYPDYKFLQSQPETYQICKELYPELYERVKEKVRAGQWIPDGAMWVEPDTNMTSGESLVRQLVHGKRFYQEEFGVDCQLLWLPDTFGYSAVMPQLLAGAGVKYMTTQKIFWSYNGSDRFPYHYFTWEGMDGSTITSFLHMDYTSQTDAATVVGRWRDRVQKRGITRFLLPFGYGDGGGGPTRDNIEDIRRNADLEGVPQMRMEAPQKFFEDCAQDGEPVNRYVGELYFQAHRGVYTSQAAIKRGNRKSEIALREAEVWSVAAQPVLPYPADTLDRRWKHVLLNQFHDILPGSSIARVYDEARKLYDDILADAHSLTQRAAAALTQGEGRTYFNSLSWERRALVKTETGYAYAVIPPMGYTSELDTAAPVTPVTVTLTENGAMLGNGVITVQLNGLGEIVSLADVKGNRRIGGKGNELRMYKDVPRKYDAWDIDSVYAYQPVALEGECRLSIAENTPYRCAVLVERSFSSSTMKQLISLEAGTARVDFDTQMDWHEMHRLLKVSFATGIHANEAMNEIQFGYVKRPTHRSRPYDADRYEVCNHRYTALCDENRGAAVLNESKYGVSMLGDEINLTLLRASTAPDLHADQGEHRFTYSYYVWDGSFMSSDVVRQGYEMNVPVVQAKGTAQTTSLMSVDAPNVIIDTVKAAEDGSGDAIIRLYECKHAATNAVLTLGIPVKSVHVCDLLEREGEELEVSDGCVRLSLRGFEVRTLRVQRA
ncbi:MAG: alpha-mannosidase [Clostridia bacterium]|nr:alpha-mannosidase [Clostridia bacterium]